jgi:4-hydroxybenzoate polyprenyltransferase
MAGWWMLTTAVYVFNGVSDIGADRGNASHRPIATGRLGLTGALLATGILSVCGLAVCAVVDPIDFVLGCGFLALGWAYSAGPAWKNHPLAFAVVIGAGACLTYAAGLICRGRATSGELPVVIMLAAWVSICCATKDFSDIAGDRMAGRRTWPILLGASRAARVLAALAVAAAASCAAFTLTLGDGVGTGLVLASGSVLLAAVLLRTAAAPQRHVRRRSYRTYMATQYAANFALMIAG